MNPRLKKVNAATLVIIMMANIIVCSKTETANAQTTEAGGEAKQTALTTRVVNPDRNAYFGTSGGPFDQ